MAAQTHTVYIPRVRPETTGDNIAWAFKYYELASVVRVDWGFKYDDQGQLLFKQAFVHLQWHENDTAQRLMNKVVDHAEGTQPPRLIYQDENYWLLLPARNPIPQHVADESYRLTVAGDVGTTLDGIVAQGWATQEGGYADGMDNAPENVRDSCRAMGLSFNNMRQWIIELNLQNAALHERVQNLQGHMSEAERQSGVSQTLQAATSESLHQYRDAYDKLWGEHLAVKEERDRFKRIAEARNTSIAQEAQKAVRLQKRADESQQTIVRLAAKAKALQSELDEVRHRPVATAPLYQRTSRRGDDPILARATGGAAADWTVVGGDEDAASYSPPNAHERADADTLSHWEWRRARNECRYGEDLEEESDDGMPVSNQTDISSTPRV